MGYLLVDNRASGGRLEEFDTKPCKHCKAVLKVYKPPYTHRCNQDCKQYGCDHEQFWCSRCKGMLCQFCGKKAYKEGACSIYEKEIEKALSKWYSNQTWQRLTGL